MRRRWLFCQLLSVLLLAACAPSPLRAPIPSHPTRPRARLPSSPDIRNEIIGYGVATEGARTLVPTSDPKEIDHSIGLLFARAGLDQKWSAQLDLSRPLAVALLNPVLLRADGVEPLLLMLPIHSASALTRALQEGRGAIGRTALVEEQPWGFLVRTTHGKIAVATSRQRGGEYAVVAWRPDLLSAAEGMLGKALAEPHEAPLVVHISVANLYSAFGPQLESITGQLARFAMHGGPLHDEQFAFAMRGVRSMTRYVSSVSEVELLANLDSGGLTLTARFKGAPEGAFATFVSQQRPGPAWGIQFIPRDAVLAFTTTSTEDGRRQDIDASLALLSASSGHRTGSEDEGRWRAALERATQVLDGPVAYGVWPSRSGGVGIGGAYRLSDPGAAPTAVMEAYEAVGVPLAAVAARAASLDTRRFAGKIRMKRKVAEVAGERAELLELGVQWPEGTSAERRVFEALFGRRLVMATVFREDHALFAIGSDWADRLATMVASSRGEPVTSLREQPLFAEALEYHDDERVSLSYLETGRMAALAADLIDRANDLGPRRREALGFIIQQLGPGAIVSTTNVQRRGFELTTHVPSAAMASGSKLSGALWRMALSPLVNPPTLPPLPVPPSNVTPTIRPPQASPTL